MAIGVLRHGSRLAGTPDLRAALVVAEMTVDGLEAIIDRPPDRNFTIRREQSLQIVLEVCQEKSADPCRLEQPHVSGLPARKIDMRIERDTGAPEHLVHVSAPDFALEAAMKGR